MRLSMATMMRLVAFAAVACAAGMPMVRLQLNGVIASWPTVAVVDAMAVPLAVGLAAFVLLRRGLVRNRLVLICAMMAAAVPAGLTTFACGPLIVLWSPLAFLFYRLGRDFRLWGRPTVEPLKYDPVTQTLEGPGW